jgi:hypothetical protein
LEVGGVQLPAGHRLSAEVLHDLERPPFPTVPVMWATDDKLADAGRLWWALRQDGTGLFPVLLDSLDPGARPGRRRPWDRQDDLFRSDAVVPGGAADIEEVVEEMFWDTWEDNDWSREAREPFASFPGLAPPQPISLRAADIEAAVARQAPAWLGLVPAGRTADVPLAVGWFGTSDAFSCDWGRWDAPGAVTGLLRSWEDRFGARVLRLGYASMHLLVERPPVTHEESLGVAAELFGVSSGVLTDHGYVSTLRRIAGQIHRSALWRFWWD